MHASLVPWQLGSSANDLFTELKEILVGNMSAKPKIKSVINYEVFVNISLSEPRGNFNTVFKAPKDIFKSLLFHALNFTD